MVIFCQAKIDIQIYEFCELYECDTNIKKLRFVSDLIDIKGNFV